MRSRRLIKKISKSLAPYFKGAWPCEDDEELMYHDEFVGTESAKGIMHVGGGTDYWGEGEDVYTVLEMAERVFFGWASFCGCIKCQNQFDPASKQEECEISKARLKIRPTFMAMREVFASKQI